jgi:hypothetical protein
LIARGIINDPFCAKRSGRSKRDEAGRVSPGRSNARAGRARRRAERAAANRATARAAIAAGFGARDIASMTTFLRDHPATGA